MSLKLSPLKEKIIKTLFGRVSPESLSNASETASMLYLVGGLFFFVALVLKMISSVVELGEKAEALAKAVKALLGVGTALVISGFLMDPRTPEWTSALFIAPVAISLMGEKISLGGSPASSPAPTE